MNRSELIQQIIDSRARLDAALELAPVTKIAETSLHNTWSVKDLLAHIGWWEQRATDIITTLCSGGVPGNAVEFGDVNALNARTYAQNRDRPLADVRESEKAAYAALLRLVETTLEADLFDDQRFAWTGGRPLFTWIVWNTYEHYDEHLVELTAWIAKNRA